LKTKPSWTQMVLPEGRRTAIHTLLPFTARWQGLSPMALPSCKRY
jgi:hypothetical protein